MTQARPVTRVCGSCRRTRPSGSSPGAFCGPYKRALFDRQPLADPDARDDLATWVWDTGPMRDALARLDFPASLVTVLAGGPDRDDAALAAGAEAAGRG